MKRWYNNSIVEVLIPEESEVPDGFVRGRLPFSDECKRNMGNSRIGRIGGFKGKHHSEESKKKTSSSLKEGYSSGRIAHRTQVPWNKGVTGAQVAWNKGISYYDYHTESDKVEMVKKIYETKSANNSFNKSKPEEDFYLFLKYLFSEADVFRNYSDNRYPFKCDFYIKPLDMFIELNLHPSHYSHPFDDCDNNDKAYKEKLSESNNEWDKMILDVWANMDVKKLKTARENGINYQMCYSNEEVQRLSKLLIEKKNHNGEIVE